jgi:hypothetical protein
MKRIAISVHNYIKDWKNLLFHAITGVLILVIALYLPVSIYIRIIILILVITFNVLRSKTKS